MFMAMGWNTVIAVINVERHTKVEVFTNPARAESAALIIDIRIFYTSELLFFMFCFFECALSGAFSVSRDAKIISTSEIPIDMNDKIIRNCEIYCTATRAIITNRINRKTSSTGNAIFRDVKRDAIVNNVNYTTNGIVSV